MTGTKTGILIGDLRASVEALERALACAHPSPDALWHLTATVVAQLARILVLDK